ncbi:MAG TPA: endonuclease MutS2 [archaeon]|nr:endonuclease MutS2 [archaeon]
MISNSPAVVSRQVRQILEYDRVLQIISGYAVSQAGKARVLALAPGTDIEYLEAEFDRLSEMLSISAGEANFSPPETPVLTEQIARLAKPGVVLEGKEIVLFGKLLADAALVRHYILRREDSLPRLSLLAGRLNPYDDLCREINRIFDENSEVRSGASPVLAKLRKDSRAVRTRIENKLKEIAEHLKEEASSGENFITLRQERYVLAIRREEMHSCPGIIQGESGSGNTLFIEPEQAVHLNNRLREIELDIRREVYRILAGLSAELSQKRTDLEINIGILAELDCLYARACYAREYGCYCPALSCDNGLLLKKARHPLLLARAGQDQKHVVPLNLELEQEERTLLVSGPNAGGKTVLLKTVGLIALMAQSGIFPPVDERTCLPVFESVLTAIGDEQSIDKDLSTFSGHVQDLNQALRNGTPRSLVLLDEIGVGTDPTEGAALASSVLEHLTRVGCLTLCTTHFGELKLLHERLPGLVNGSLEFDTEKMRPTFIFNKGIPGQSYGLVIARNMGLSDSVLQRAREYMKGEVVNINEYIARLEEQQKKLSRELDSAQLKSGELEMMARKMREDKVALDERTRELAKKEKEFDSRIAEKERSMLLKARKDVEEVISRLEREFAQEKIQAAAKDARKALEDRIHELKTADRTPAVKRRVPREPDVPIQVGDRVRMAGLDLEGEVMEGPDSSGKYTVISGRAKMSLAGDALVRLGRKRPAGSRAVYDLSAVEIASGQASQTVDLRGMHGDEIAEVLDRFLSEAEMAGLGEVVVIHGKGTGALRARVAELLANDPRVESFRAGAWNEGGTGATVVCLRH